MRHPLRSVEFFLVLLKTIFCVLYVGYSEIKERVRSESKERLRSESEERLRIQPAQVFHCTSSVVWCVQ